MVNKFKFMIDKKKCQGPEYFFLVRENVDITDIGMIGICFIGFNLVLMTKVSFDGTTI